MGNGTTINVDLGDVIDEDWSECLNIDIKLRPSKILQNADFWHSPTGITT